MKKFIDEFKVFAMKGNVVDLAIAVVIGTAFGKIVSSLVANIITPIIGLLSGGVDLSGLSYTIGESVIMYGIFMQSVIDFVIISFVIFVIVKAINRTRILSNEYEEKNKVKNPKEPDENVLLLREIRDILKK